MSLPTNDETQTDKLPGDQVAWGSDQLVNPGACLLGDQLMQCALEPGACHGQIFKSHRELQGTIHAESCQGQFSSHQGNHIGMCATAIEKYVCTGHASNCALPFADKIPFCNLQYNHFPETEVPFALYGRCAPISGSDFTNYVSEGTCVWSVEDCPKEENSFIPAFQQAVFDDQANHDHLCTCDKVKVGACVHVQSNYFACAVSQYACDPESKFKTWQQLEEVGRDCRLCEAFDKVSPVEKYSSPHYQQQQDPQCSVVGVSILGAVYGVSVMIFCVWIALRWKRGSRDEKISEPSKDDNADLDTTTMTIT